MPTWPPGTLWTANLLSESPNLAAGGVINLSLGTDESRPELAGTVAAVQAKGVLVAATTGNYRGHLLYLAALPGVITVTALAGPQASYQPGYANCGPGVALTA